MPPIRSSARRTANRASSNAANSLDLNLLESSQRVTRGKVSRILRDNNLRTIFLNNSPLSGPPASSSTVAGSKNRPKPTFNTSVANLGSQNPAPSSTDSSPLRSVPSSTSSSPLSSVPSSTCSSPLSPAPSSPSTSRNSSTVSTTFSPYSSTPSFRFNSSYSSAPPSPSSVHSSTYSFNNILPHTPINYFNPCTSGFCPIKPLHNVGIYYHRGQPPPSNHAHSLFGYSNPPPEIWAALDRFRNGPATAADLRLMADFVECHAGDDAPCDPEPYDHFDYASNTWNDLI